jgi:hypothetical protein
VKALAMSIVIAATIIPASVVWSGEEACSSDDMKCRKIQICDEEKAVTVRVLNDRKQQCEAKGGAAWRPSSGARTIRPPSACLKNPAML